MLATGTGEDDLTIEVEADDAQLRLCVGPLHDGVGSDAGLLRIVRPLVDDVAPDVRDDGEWLVLSLDRGGD